jgi:hypothetical protein
MKRNTTMFRCKLAKLVGDRMIYVTYIGPYESIPKGWSMFMKRVTGPTGGVAA